MATCADLLGVALPEDAGEDSVSLLPLLRGEEGPRREHVIHHSSRGVFAVRQDEWVYIDGCGGDVPEPDWWKSERNYVDSECPAESPIDRQISISFPFAAREGKWWTLGDSLPS